MSGFQCSKKHKTMIKDLFFISGLQPDFTKSSGDDPHFFLHCLRMTIATFAANKNSWKSTVPDDDPLWIWVLAQVFCQVIPWLPTKFLETKIGVQGTYPPYVNFVKYWPYLCT